MATAARQDARRHSSDGDRAARPVRPAEARVRIRISSRHAVAAGARVGLPIRGHTRPAAGGGGRAAGRGARPEEGKGDMERARPMDRLLVGDVGYGKTEVALRAAFKAVQAGKQVAVLVPTTILAEQHGRTFRERLADYPVRVEVLSRFRTAKDTKDVTRR